MPFIRVYSITYLGFFSTDSAPESQSGFRFGRCQRQPSSAIFLLSFLILEVAAFQQNIGRIGKSFFGNFIDTSKVGLLEKLSKIQWLSSLQVHLHEFIFMFANILSSLLIVWINFPILSFYSLSIQIHMSYNEIDLSSHNDMPLTKNTHFLTVWLDEEQVGRKGRFSCSLWYCFCRTNCRLDLLIKINEPNVRHLIVMKTAFKMKRRKKGYLLCWCISQVNSLPLLYLHCGSFGLLGYFWHIDSLHFDANFTLYGDRNNCKYKKSFQSGKL